MWKRFGLFSLAMAMVALAANSGRAEGTAKGPLDGKTYAVQLKGPDGKVMPDALAFTKGSMDSAACHQFGIFKNPYTAKAEGKTTNFQVTGKSQKDASTTQWTGAVTGHEVSGTMKATMADGKTMEYTFTGKERKATAAAPKAHHAKATPVKAHQAK